jgi:hypothetical protein
MKAERVELAALAAAAGPQRSPLEISTSAYLADFTAACAAVCAVPEDVRQERIQALRGIVARPSDVEAMRAAVWLNAPHGARMVAVLSAGLHKDRAKDSLNTFDAFERGLVWIALQKLLVDLGQIQKCMQGGRMPARTGEVH